MPQKTTHIASLAEFATKLEKSANNPHDTDSPINTLSKYLGLALDSHQFLRVLTCVIAFYHEGADILNRSNLTAKTRSAASVNLKMLFTPFLPPFGGSIHACYKQSMSQTNQSYFDLLSDSIVTQHPIFVPDAALLDSYKNSLAELRQEMAAIGLPKWINDDFSESLYLIDLAITKLPFLGHRIIQDSHNTVLARLFSVASPEHKNFMVKVATVTNVILAAFIMPHEAVDAGSSYYGWMIESRTDQKQIDACAKPLALPAPAVTNL